MRREVREHRGMRIPARILSSIVACAALAALVACGPKPAEFVPLFNGENLDGWKMAGDAQFLVRDGCLVGTQDTGKGGDIWTEADHGDFEFRAMYKVKWPANSGFWYRWNPETKKGYQFDILKHPKPVAYSGSVYCPGKLFLWTNLVESAENRDDWNEARIWAKACHMIVWLNGKRLAEVHDMTFDKGKIGIQVHGGDGFKGMEIVAKDIRIRPVGPGEQPPTD